MANGTKERILATCTGFAGRACHDDKEAIKMSRKALVVIDIQNDITRHCRDIIDNINSAILVLFTFIIFLLTDIISKRY